MAGETEAAAETAKHVDVQAEATKLIDQVSNMDFNTMLEKWIIPYGSKLLIALAIYVFGKWIARFISKLMGKAAYASSKDEMLQSFVSSTSYFLLLLFVIIAALSQLGINTSSLVALIGAAGLAIGLALQSSLQNFASGVMILLFKPFTKGDYIEAGDVAGTVEQMGLLMLEVRSPDNKSVLVPNAKIFEGSITNFSDNATRRIDFIFDIAYDADIEKAKAIISECVRNDERTLDYPEPVIAVGSLAASSVQIFARPWVKTPDYWSTHFDLLEKVKVEFDKAGIEIPFNKLDINLPEGQSLELKK